MSLVFALIFAILYAVVAWRSPKIALVGLFTLLPTYLLRFSFGPIPSTFLEVMVIALTLRTIVFFFTNPVFQYSVVKRFEALAKERWLLYGVSLFLLGGAIGLYVSLDLRAALGEWKAFYLEAILVGLLTYIYAQTRRDVMLVFDGLLLTGAILGLYTIIQRFTGIGVPYAFWENGASYRITGWYGFPNAVGHTLSFVGILATGLFLFIPQTEPKQKERRILLGKVTFFALLGVLFAKSTGGFMAILAGIGVYLLFYKKTRLPVLIVGIASVIALLLLPAQNPLRQELLAQNRSGQIRMAMWGEALQVIKDSPVAGAGLASYTYRVIPYHNQVNGENIEIFHHPHNIFLTMWVNLGLTGLVGFVMILIWIAIRGIELVRANIAEAVIILALGAGFLMSGLVDSPYIKNDLSILFWLMPAVILCLLYERKTKNS